MTAMIRAADTVYRTDTGRQRRENEDSALARAPVFVVADGMGGAQAGEVASRIAIEAFEPGLDGSGSPEERLADRVREANREIYDRSRTDHGREGMGTTLTAAYLDDGSVAIAHVGDSRAYLFRDGKLTRLTQDHSLVDELVRRGKLTEEQAAEHPQRSIITRALGPEPEVEVDTWTYPVRRGDVLLLCSDGLTSMITEQRIAEILGSSSNLEEAADRLIGDANEAGGRDNITVVLTRVEEVGDGAGAVEQPTVVGQPVAGRERRSGAARAGATARADHGEEHRAASPEADPDQARRPNRGGRGQASPGPAVRQAGRGPDRRRGRALPGRRRGVPGDAPAVLRRHQLAGDRDDLPGTPVRPSGRDPPVRDVLRFRRPGVARACRPAQERLQQSAALADERAEPGEEPRAGADSSERGRESMSARNRELIGLIPASLLVTAGFAGVFIQRSNALSNISLTYGAIFLGLCLIGHIVIRMTLPNADPYMFPLVAALASFGIVMIYRINPTLARQQAQWFVLGLILFALTIIFARDYRKLERYRYTIVFISLGLMILPRLPGIGYQANGAYLGVRIPVCSCSSRRSSRRSDWSSSSRATCATPARCSSPAAGGSWG